jgi:hypothetical protein
MPENLFLFKQNTYNLRIYFFGMLLPVLADGAGIIP